MKLPGGIQIIQILDNIETVKRAVDNSPHCSTLKQGASLGISDCIVCKGYSTWI